MKKIVKLKQGEAAIIFRNGSTIMVQNDEEGGTSKEISNAACITYALQHPLFIKIAIRFIADLEQMKHQLQTGETVH